MRTRASDNKGSVAGEVNPRPGFARYVVVILAVYLETVSVAFHHDEAAVPVQGNGRRPPKYGSVCDEIWYGAFRCAGRLGLRPGRSPLTGVCMGFLCRGMVGDLQVELGFRPGFGQQPDPVPEPAPEQQPPQPVDAVADYADGPARPAPTAVVSGRQVFRRRSQVAWSNPPVIGVFPPWSHRPGSAASPPPTPANAAKSAPGQFYGSYPISIPGS